MIITMKTLTSLLIGCSLALAGAALAQQPVEQQSPSKGQRAPEKAHETEAQPGRNAPNQRERPNPQERPAKQSGAVKERNATNERAATNEHAATKERAAATKERAAATEPGAEKGRKTHAARESANAEKSNEPRTGKNENERATEQSANAPASSTQQQTEQQRKEQAEQQRQGVKQPATEAGATSATSTTNQQNVQARAEAKAKPAPQQVQQVKSQHANFKAQPKPQQVPSVTFNQNYRIEGSDRWQGQQYQVFRSYQPQWHDQGWYHSHYNNVVLIGGGYYFFNAGYWFPAWGYSASAQYYPYDGPIYAGHGAEPPDKVIADTQALLQQMGYYKGEVDGLLGPLTREALTAYQAEQGLTQTAAIDQPTLDSLGLA